jgi:hypothetical protein
MINEYGSKKRAKYMHGSLRTLAEKDCVGSLRHAVTAIRKFP